MRFIPHIRGRFDCSTLSHLGDLNITLQYMSLRLAKKAPTPQCNPDNTVLDYPNQGSKENAKVRTLS
jgi:hypothetical protein